MKKVSYRLEKTGDFVIENYSQAKAFSSFFPGIAGLYGIPLWAFYVNRGQCVASFGTGNKDGAILEFFPANQAYDLTSVKGFRTFLKIRKGKQAIFYEPFRESPARLSRRASTKMTINPSRLDIEETNNSLGIRTQVSYITAPQERFAALLRKVTVTNISGRKLDAELVDGLSHVVPFGVTDWQLKHISRTVEAWMKATNLEKNAPFYHVKVRAFDEPETAYVKRGNFYLACKRYAGRAKILQTIVDPDVIFGRNGDISYPRAFVESSRPVIVEPQASEGKTPSAFAYTSFSLKRGQAAEILSIAGNADEVKTVNMIARKIKDDASYFARKASENTGIIGRIQDHIFTKSGRDEFDFYARYTYLDNILRGGLPVNIGGGKGDFIFYAYSRKHGDLERDYNDFMLQPSYYSQGNGAYRDINQNRRNDPRFYPAVGDDNIMTFLNAIQPDGFNPHRLEGVTLSIKDAHVLDICLKKHVKNASSRENVKRFLLRGFTPGSLLYFLKSEKILDRNKAVKAVQDIAAASAKEDVIRPGEGYWVDHWTYNMDLIESYLACYPEKLLTLLLDKKDFTFYDTFLRVNPRSEKYVFVDGKIRQSGAVTEDERKRLLIESRGREPHAVRSRYGFGRVYKTNLLVKLLCVAVNKMASLDPFGIGIEMEAGKPGWCDSLNGLPAIFGSSLCEVFELKRLLLFLRSSLGSGGVPAAKKIVFPSELVRFLQEVKRFAEENLASKSARKDFTYWDRASAAKERYRRKVWGGFSGKERTVSVRHIRKALDIFLAKLEKGIGKGFDKKAGMTRSYYINKVEKFRFLYENGKKQLNDKGLPYVKALSFSHRPVSLFLEGPMHAMRLMDTKSARSLYRAVRKSGIFDRKLKMYKLNEPLRGMPTEIGRQTVFLPGWLENESVWMHMEYKYLLEILKSGLHKEFFSDIKNCFIFFQDPRRYGRSILENSSFIVSSAYPNQDLHGNGFIARLSGVTAEFLSLWLYMCQGPRPFKLDGAGKLYFELEPVLPKWLFTKEASLSHFYSGPRAGEDIRLPENIFAFCFLRKTLVVYHNPKRGNTFGKDAVLPKKIILKKYGMEALRFINSVPAPYAHKIRERFYDRIDVTLA